jgi:hypothetical protein
MGSGEAEHIGHNSQTFDSGDVPRDRPIWIVSNEPLVLAWQEGNPATPAERALGICFDLDDSATPMARLIGQADIEQPINRLVRVDESWKELSPESDRFKVAKRVEMTASIHISQVLELLKTGSGAWDQLNQSH